MHHAMVVRRNLTDDISPRVGYLNIRQNIFYVGILVSWQRAAICQTYSLPRNGCERIMPNIVTSNFWYLQTDRTP